jgi:uncharacterized protein YhfF
MSSDLLRSFWSRFATSQGEVGLPDQPYAIAEFGDSPKLADALSQLILERMKTATCSLLWEYEITGESIPRAGQRSIVLNSAKVPLCIIETISVEIRWFGDVDAQFAWEEGEGDRSLEHWRQEHLQFFSRALHGTHRLLNEDTPLVCERFHLLYVD